MFSPCGKGVSDITLHPALISWLRDIISFGSQSDPENLMSEENGSVICREGTLGGLGLHAGTVKGFEVT